MEVEPERALFGKPEWWRYRRNTRSGPPGSRGALRQLVNDDPLSAAIGKRFWMFGIVPRTETDKVMHLSRFGGVLATLGVPLLLDEGSLHATAVALARLAILRTAARFYFGNADPIGKR